MQRTTLSAPVQCGVQHLAEARQYCEMIRRHSWTWRAREKDQQQLELGADPGICSVRRKAELGDT